MAQSRADIEKLPMSIAEYLRKKGLTTEGNNATVGDLGRVETCLEMLITVVKERSQEQLGKSQEVLTAVQGQFQSQQVGGMMNTGGNDVNNNGDDKFMRYFAVNKKGVTRLSYVSNTCRPPTGCTANEVWKCYFFGRGKIPSECKPKAPWGLTRANDFATGGYNISKVHKVLCVIAALGIEKRRRELAASGHQFTFPLTQTIIFEYLHKNCTLDDSNMIFNCGFWELFYYLHEMEFQKMKAAAKSTNLLLDLYDLAARAIGNVFGDANDNNARNDDEQSAELSTKINNKYNQFTKGSINKVYNMLPQVETVCKRVFIVS